jgi:hypothetical protein
VITPVGYGFRYWEAGKEVHLQQIAGGGRIRLLVPSTGKSWWGRPPRNKRWEIYEASSGHYFPDIETARRVLALLSGAGRPETQVSECTK